MPCAGGQLDGSLLLPTAANLLDANTLGGSDDAGSITQSGLQHFGTAGRILRRGIHGLAYGRGKERVMLVEHASPENDPLGKQ